MLFFCFYPYLGDGWVGQTQTWIYPYFFWTLPLVAETYQNVFACQYFFLLIQNMWQKFLKLSSQIAISIVFYLSLDNENICSFHVALSVCLGLLAVSTLRMKCFWSPYICLLASAGVADPTLWSLIISKVRLSQRLQYFHFFL